MINNRRHYLVLFVIITLALFLVLPGRAIDPLPSDDDVVNITAGGFFLGRNKEQVEFQMPLSHWPRVRAALEPATRDDHPAGWVHLGGMSITTRSQRTVKVMLFDTRADPPGAFAAGPTFDRRVYYRGGDSVKLIRELSAAYDASQRKDSSP